MFVRDEMQGALCFLSKTIQGRLKLKGYKISKHVNNNVQQEEQDSHNKIIIRRWDSNLYQITLDPVGTLSFISNNATTAAGESALMPWDSLPSWSYLYYQPIICPNIYITNSDNFKQIWNLLIREFGALLSPWDETIMTVS